MKESYRRWLEQQYSSPKTRTNQMSEARRVEKHHGDLDEHYDSDRMESLIEMLRYSADDERHNRPNPSRILIDGNIHNNLASYRSAVRLYRRFRGAAGD